jgi:hypothetical protein
MAPCFKVPYVLYADLYEKFRSFAGKTMLLGTVKAHENDRTVIFLAEATETDWNGNPPGNYETF